MEYKILSIERKNNSVNGNPKYEVYFEDPEGNFGHATTMSDAGFCYGITNNMYRESDPQVMATLHFTRAGRISGFKTTKKLWEDKS